MPSAISLQRSQSVDHALGEIAALGIDRVGVVGRVDERILRGCVDLDDLEAEWFERLAFKLVAAAGDREAGTLGRDDLELSQYVPLSRTTDERCRMSSSVQGLASIVGRNRQLLRLQIRGLGEPIDQGPVARDPRSHPLGIADHRQRCHRIQEFRGLRGL